MLLCDFIFRLIFVDIIWSYYYYYFYVIWASSFLCHLGFFFLVVIYLDFYFILYINIPIKYLRVGTLVIY